MCGREALIRAECRREAPSLSSRMMRRVNGPCQRPGLVSVRSADGCGWKIHWGAGAKRRLSQPFLARTAFRQPRASARSAVFGVENLCTSGEKPSIVSPRARRGRSCVRICFLMLPSPEFGAKHRQSGARGREVPEVALESVSLRFHRLKSARSTVSRPHAGAKRLKLR